MDRAKTIAGIKFLLSTLVVAVLTGCSIDRPAVIVGSKNFTESVLAGEIIAQHLEQKIGNQVTVKRRLNLGGTLFAHQALLKGDIDLYPEYTGTAFTAVLNHQATPGMASSDAMAVFHEVREEYAHRFHLAWVSPLGVNNGFAMVVRGPEARERNLENLSSAARAGVWNLGVGYEFEQRPDGLPALERVYGLRIAGAPKTMDLGLLYKALESRQVDMIAASETDGLLSKMDLKVLRDDKHAFPPYELCVVAREDRLQAVPGLRAALQELSGKFNNQTMQRLNYAVDGEHRGVNEVASEFLKEAGL